MEDLIYQSEVAFELEAVEESARSCGYESRYQDVSGIVFLEILATPPPYPKIWQWVKASKETVNALVRRDPEMMVPHASGTAYVIDFSASTVPELAAFLKRLLLVYGGWVGMEDDAVEDEVVAVYNAADIETMVEHPLFAPAEARISPA